MWSPETSKVLDALEKLGSPVSIAQVVSETGLPTNVVEAEMASILHATQGFFELPSRKGEGALNQIPPIVSRKRICKL